MATTTTIERHSGLARSSGVRVADGGERGFAFASAHRHTIAVRLLRWVLPAACLGIVAVYAGALMRASLGSSSLPEIALQRILPEDLTMHNPKYDGFDKDGGSYSFTAKTAQRDKTNLDAIVLNTISGELVDADKTKTRLTATRGLFNHKTSVLDLFEAIDIVSESGLQARLTRATVQTKQSIVFSNQPVEIQFTAGSVTSQQMILKQKLREAAFIGDVKAKLLPPKPDARANATDTAKLFGGSNAPVDIGATRLDVRDAAKIAVFSGDVVAAQSGAVLKTPSLEVSYEGEPAGTITAGRSSEKSADTQERGKLRRITAKGPVTMTQATGEIVTTDGADFDAVNETAVLAGNVVMQAGTDRRATSDRADLDQKAETALLTGNVIVMQGQNEIKGRRLFIDRKGGRTQLTSPPGIGSGPGRVSARLVQGDGKTSAGRKTTRTSAGDDGSETSGQGISFKTDPGAPVDIEADQLDVADAVRTAIFRGDVRAAQGDFIIRTAELQATYSGDAGLADIGAAAKPAAQSVVKPDAKKEATTLTRIQAKRNVVVTSKGGQTVTGDWADYDAKANKVVVGGEVVLSQGQTRVKGARLVIDMTTGQSTIDTAPGQSAVQPARDGWIAEAGDPQGLGTNLGRPSAVFFPGQLREAAKKSQKKPTGGNQGWGAETAPVGGN